MLLYQIPTSAMLKQPQTPQEWTELAREIQRAFGDGTEVMEAHTEEKLAALLEEDGIEEYVRGAYLRLENELEKDMNYYAENRPEEHARFVDDAFLLLEAIRADLRPLGIDIPEPKKELAPSLQALKDRALERIRKENQPIIDMLERHPDDATLYPDAEVPNEYPAQQHDPEGLLDDDRYLESLTPDEQAAELERRRKEAEERDEAVRLDTAVEELNAHFDEAERKRSLERQKKWQQEKDRIAEDEQKRPRRQ